MSIEIVEYVPAHANAFKELNLDWIKKYFKVEKPDMEVLSDPEKYIINPGGCIFFAKDGEKIVGTCAMVKKGTAFELAKMAVSESHRGMHIGERLGKAVIQRARERGALEVSLETNDMMKPAVGLYKKLGFVVTNRPEDEPASRYERSNVYMRLIVKQLPPSL